MIIATAQRDYYEVLGVPKDAEQKAIKDAFRKLALQYHPDRNKAPGAEERFKEIAEAYAVLSDPKKRSEYDTRGFAGVAGFSREDLFSGIDFGDLFSGLDLGFGGGLFDHFFHRNKAGPERGANIEVELTVPLEKVASGGAEKVRLPYQTACSACHGSGAAAGTQPITCKTCNGTGQQTTSRRETRGKNNVVIQQITTCPACGGRGVIIDKPCPDCGGTGKTEQEEILSVTIPVGVEEGMALRIPERGMPSREPGGTAGDLFVVVHSAADPRFERDGADLWRSEMIALTDAVLGTKLKVPTLDHPAEVTIPPGTQPDAVLRVRGKGLPEFGGKHHGDLYLRIQVHIPEQLSSEELATYQKLRNLAGERRSSWWHR
ncbi:MAG TPA: DnaJ C-terminal domain-containing protein [Sulfuriferula sp.]|nr:DnaJ C-terminal domain-containing protein [Sulfuriferula sp.]